jgi:hypothetical protein
MTVSAVTFINFKKYNKNPKADPLPLGIRYNNYLP